MEKMFQISSERLRITPMQFFRYLNGEIDWSNRLIGISGSRGVGKTTLMLQHIKQHFPMSKDVLYASLDDVYFTQTPLVSFAGEFFKQGGTHLFLDEVHKYPNWSQEIKNIYDNLAGLQVVFSGSSALDIHKGAYDLSRRAMVYSLPGLSFREFLTFKHNTPFQPVLLESLLQGNIQDVLPILDTIRPIKYFPEYLKSGYYPYAAEDEPGFLSRLSNTINLTVEVDIPAVHHIDFYSIQKIRKLLSIIADIVPYKPNIEKLARQIGTTRDSLLKYLFYLEKSEIVNWLTRDTFGINYLNKPDKLYLQNSNLMFALSRQKPNTGSIRETFFLNQLKVKHKANYTEKGDFLIDDKYYFEIGGAGKSSRQIQEISDSYLVVDHIEYPYKNRIPLWLFGFLY